MKYIPGLNGIRALAVAAVVWHHSPVEKPAQILENGFLGVDVFFILSGYLITSLLIHEQHRFGTISLKQFYARRTLRIFPLYYAVLAVLAVYFWWQGDAGFLSGLPYHLTYTSNWVHTRGLMEITWSLSTEEQFYLLWPVLFIAMSRKVSLLIMGAFLLLNQAVNFGLLNAWVPYERLPILQCTFTPIILGSLLAFALDEHEASLRKVPAWTVALVAGCIMLVAASAADMRGVPRLTFHLATAAFLAALVLDPGLRIVRLLEWPPIAYVGKVSYGVYLLHMVGLYVASRLLHGWTFVAGFAITLVMAAVSYSFFERPLLRLKDRFRPADDKRALHSPQ